MHFKALISLAGSASLRLHLVITEGTSAVYELAPVYIPIMAPQCKYTHTYTHTQGCTNTLTDLKASTYARPHTCRQSRKLSSTQTHTHTHTHTHRHLQTHTHLKENHNGREALSDHLTSAQHPSINRKTGSAPQGRKQHLESRLEWGFVGWRCATSMCVVLFQRAVYYLVYQKRSWVKE